MQTALVCRTAGMQRPVLAGDCVRAAYDLTGYLGISHSLWSEACAGLGEQAAAVCVVLIDQAMHRQYDPVRKPNGYFRSMLRKAERGGLHLHKSVFGNLKRGSVVPESRRVAVTPFYRPAANCMKIPLHA